MKRIQLQILQLAAALAFCAMLMSGHLSFAFSGDESATSVQIIDTNKIIQSSLSARQKSLALADTAESLISPYGFMVADKIFDSALEYDGANQKARFYKAMLKPMVALKGILKRIEPLMAKEDSESRALYHQRAGVHYPNSSLQSFLLDGAADIRNEKDIQHFVDQILGETDGVRTFLRANRNMKLTLKPTVYATNLTPQEQFENCYTKEIAKGVYARSVCGKAQTVSMEISAADVEVLRQIVAGAEMSLIFATSYDLTGSLNFRAAMQKGWKPTDRDFVNYFSRVRDFGTLRSTSGLTLIQAMGSDIFAGAKWASRNQESLCNSRKSLLGQACTGPRAKGSRVKDVFNIVEMTLDGQSVDVLVDSGKVKVGALKSGSPTPEYQTQAHLLAPVLNPVQDLKALMPNQFNSCGQATNVGDPTLGGLLPAGDAQIVLTKASALKRNCR
jgi:hypothetical protein